LLVGGALVTSNDAALRFRLDDSVGTFTAAMYGGIFYEHSHRLIAERWESWLIIEAIALWRYERRRWLRCLH